MVTPYTPPASFLTSLGLGSVPAGVWTTGLVFPLFQGQDIAVKRSPVMSSLLKTAASGRERATALWSSPKWRYEVPLNVLRDRASNAELAVLEEFFLNCAGRANTFNYFDPQRNLAAGEPAGTGDGSTTSFQLLRAIRGYNEPVYAPYATGLVVTVNGTPTGVTLGSNGVVTFASAPANGTTLAWSGYYYYLCRMETDEQAIAKMFSDLWSADKIAWRSVKP